MESTDTPPLRRYRIERYLAEGGMGAIYVGKKLGAGGFEKEVVLKQLLPEFTTRPEFRDLFFREAKISGTLDHTNIVRTYDLVRSEDALFIVMEYVRGADLRTICWRARLRRKPLSAAAILHVAMEILAGLAYAHGRRDGQGKSLGIIHRDVSPSNILCSGQGDVKLSDFGIAKASTFVSVFYKVRGKVGYMSPEQARNQPIDARSDLYSLAVCVYEALTGERLFVGDLQTPADQIYSQPVPPLATRCPGLPPALDDVMQHALTSSAAERYQDAATFAAALRQVARDHGLLYSTRQLADELRDILGPQPENWMFELGTGSQDTERIPLAKELEGKEAFGVGDVGRGDGDGPHGAGPGLYDETPILQLPPPTQGAVPLNAAPVGSESSGSVPRMRLPTPPTGKRAVPGATPPTGKAGLRSVTPAVMAAIPAAGPERQAPTPGRGLPGLRAATPPRGVGGAVVRRGGSRVLVAAVLFGCLIAAAALWASGRIALP